LYLPQCGRSIFASVGVEAPASAAGNACGGCDGTCRLRSAQLTKG
jgi:hypothetical protein